MEEHDQPAQERSELNKDSRSNSNSPNRSPGNTTGCQNQTTVSSISFLFSSIGKKGVEMAKLAAEKTQSAYEKHIASPQGGGQASKVFVIKDNLQHFWFDHHFIFLNTCSL